MTAAKLIAEARRAHRMSASDESRPTLYGRLADALEHADHIARLHEEATQRAAAIRIIASDWQLGQFSSRHFGAHQAMTQIVAALGSGEDS